MIYRMRFWIFKANFTTSYTQICWKESPLFGGGIRVEHGSISCPRQKAVNLKNHFQVIRKLCGIDDDSLMNLCAHARCSLSMRWVVCSSSIPMHPNLFEMRFERLMHSIQTYTQILNPPLLFSQSASATVWMTSCQLKVCTMLLLLHFLQVCWIIERPLRFVALF